MRSLSPFLHFFLCFSATEALAGSAAPAPSVGATTLLELQYFGARGAAETIRVLLALAGETYTDTRFEITPGSFEAPDFRKAKESGALAANMGRAPILNVQESKDDKKTTTVGQSRAIERYLAKQLGLMGENDLEAAQIDCLAEHCRDIKDAQRYKSFSAFNRDKTDEEKAELRKEWFETDLPGWLAKVETAVQLSSGKSGYAFGQSNSYADVVIFSLLRDCTIQADQADTLTAAKDCPLLLSIADRIANDPKVKAWVESRPESMF